MLNEAGLRFLQPFLFTTNLSGTPFDDVLGALQTLARAAGCLCHVSSLVSMNRSSLVTDARFGGSWQRQRRTTATGTIARPGGAAALNIQRLVYRSSYVARDAITSHLSSFYVTPQRRRLQAARTPDDIRALLLRHLMAATSVSIGTLSVWRELAEPALHHSGRTLARNLGCLRTPLTAALFLAGTLGPSWFAVLEAVPNADYVPATCGTAPGSAPLGTGAVAGTPSKRGGTQIEAQVEEQQQRHQTVEHPLLADVDSESVQVAI
jgi:hypothetical protein